MRKLLILSTVLLTSLGTAAQAALLYPISVDTSSIAGTAGSLDFQFNPGPNTTQFATLTILGFSGNGTLAGGPIITGDASGDLSSAVAFDNAMGFNDYFEGFTFGTTLTFTVLLDGPAIESPDGTSSSGSAFAFSMFSDAAGTIAALTSDPNGFAATVNVNLDGTTTASSASSPQTTIGSLIVTPEPGGFVFAGFMFTLIGAVRASKRTDSR